MRGQFCHLIAIFALIVASLCAQSDFGSIVGFAKDPTGAVIPNARATVTYEGTAQQRSTITNDSGYYVITNLPPGLYTISADTQGFSKFSSQHNRLDPNSTLSVDLALPLGRTTETVEVQGSAATLDR